MRDSYQPKAKGKVGRATRLSLMRDKEESIHYDFYESYEI